MEKEELAKLLKENLKYEKEVIDFYQDKVFLIPDKKIREDILLLIKQSHEHAYKFRKHLLEKQFDIDVGKETMSEMDLTDFLEEGLEEEKRLEDKYKEQLQRIEDEEVREDIEEIMKQEKAH